jgi:hypothetical protein
MNIWSRNGNCVSTMSPAPDDLFVVTTLFGKRVFVQPITEYEKALATAQKFADFVQQPRPVVVKVLCLSHAEMTDAMGIDPATLFEGQTPEQEAQLRQLVVTACKTALLDGPQAAVRADAMQLLINMGVMMQ